MGILACDSLESLGDTGILSQAVAVQSAHVGTETRISQCIFKEKTVLEKAYFSTRDRNQKCDRTLMMAKVPTSLLPLMIARPKNAAPPMTRQKSFISLVAYLDSDMVTHFARDC